MSHEFTGFGKTLAFLKDLNNHNHREWFQENKARYENEFVQCAQAFIDIVKPELHKLTPHFVASSKKVGGSLMRIYRDTRFGHDKTPYKTNMGIQFRHVLGKDVHAPGFYVHIQPAECFIGVGIWRPNGAALNRIRNFIVDNPESWKNSILNNKFQSHFSLTGDSLVRPPKGFDSEHPLITDLKRKDFIAVTSLTQAQVSQANFPEDAAQLFKIGSPFMKYLCTALELNY